VPASIVDELAAHVAAYAVGGGRYPEALIFAGD
jgi:hypothetical protein